MRYDPSDRTSYSALTMHRQCPQAWVYRYLRRLRRIDGSPPFELDFGNWWHALRAADEIQTGRAEETILYAPETLQPADGWPPIAVPADGTIAYFVLDSASDWWRSKDAEYRDAFVDLFGAPLVDRLRYLAARYGETYGGDPDEDVLAVELPFVRTLPGAYQGYGDLQGRIDLVYRDRRRNLIVVRDHKTGKDAPASETADDLMDSQLHVYAWAVSAWLSERGLTLGAVSYDRVRTVAPKTPAVTASGGLSASIKDYDLATYLAWAAGDDGEGVSWGVEGEYFKTGKRAGEPKFGRYVAEDSVVERLSIPAARAKWLDRTLTPLSRHVVRAHVRSAARTQSAMVETVAAVEADGEAARNFTRLGCGRCDYADLCRAELISGPGGDYPLGQFGLTDNR